MTKRCAKFFGSCFNSHNLIVRNISMAAKISSFSDFGDNYRYLSYNNNNNKLFYSHISKKHIDSTTVKHK